MRSCSQSISYEISLAIIFFSLVLLFFRIKLTYGYLWYVIRIPIILILLPVWFLSTIAEVNRAPFDFREGERELISGFNVEYRATAFVFLFLAEYGIIIFFSLLTVYFFFLSGGAFVVSLLIYILVRRVYPRFRYDILIKIT